eukprot:1763639-Alexandrium_andersonii.AAC.1
MDLARPLREALDVVRAGSDTSHVCAVALGGRRPLSRAAPAAALCCTSARTCSAPAVALAV